MSTKIDGLPEFLASPESEGLSNCEIGRKFGVNEGTVRRARKAKSGDSATMTEEHLPVIPMLASPKDWDTLLRVDQIRTDGGTQIRLSAKESTIEEYAEFYRSSKYIHPIAVCYDGTEYWLADGFQRLAAVVKLGIEKINCEVMMGDRRDAILYAVASNTNHGDRRTREDARNAVKTLLLDEEWSQWSDRKIGVQCEVDHKTVASVRRELKQAGEIPQVDSRRVVSDRRGRNYGMDTANIGHKAGGNGQSRVNGIVREDPPAVAKAIEPSVETDQAGDDFEARWESNASAIRSMFKSYPKASRGYFVIKLSVLVVEFESLCQSIAVQKEGSLS